jgi:HTH-type transcriptional regulator/antitoxin HigA
MTAYQELLLDYSPRPVRNEREYRRTMRSIDRLMKKPRLSRAESELLELLSTLAEQYESIECPTPKASQKDMLAHFLDARGITQAELARQTGIARSVITNVLKGRRRISQANIARLAKYFHVPAAEWFEDESWA